MDSSGGGGAEPQDLPGSAGAQELLGAGPVGAPPQMPPVDAPEAVAGPARNGVEEPIRSAAESPVAPLLAVRPLAPVSTQRAAEQWVSGELWGAVQGMAQDHRVAGSPQAPGGQREGAELTRAVTEAPSGRAASPAPGPATQPHGTAPLPRIQRNVAGPSSEIEVKPRFSSVSEGALSEGIVQSPRPEPWPAGDRLPLATVQRAATPVPAGADPRTAALSTGLATVDSDGAIVFPGLAAHIAPMGETASATPVQREAAPTTAEAPAASPGAGATPAGGAAPGAGDKPAELDELAKKLYERIRTRLKAELRLDRERAGLLTDLGR